MDDYAQEIRDAAYRALRNGGLLRADSDLVGLFALDNIKIVNGRAVVPPDFVKTSRASKPDLFSRDAMAMTSAEIEASINKIATANAKERLKRESDKFLADLKQKYAA